MLKMNKPHLEERQATPGESRWELEEGIRLRRLKDPVGSLRGEKGQVCLKLEAWDGC